MKVTVSPNVIFQELDEKLVLLNLETEEYYGLDAVGGRMWKLLETHSDSELATHQLCEMYNVSFDRANADIRSLISKLSEAKLLNVVVE